ncbi:hypothetical protein BDM02DRAFT_3114509 [Thelephora ganbajun]|uniref:Uncharacterized protein n=1 Tax=Thelephora ganbajun TaxID=370292 RepID=A0ACB6ZH55_THEGA|nr:hypothetical protein BDM02DRAFT_3114509 [Thelephora ganbajun]
MTLPSCKAGLKVAHTTLSRGTQGFWVHCSGGLTAAVLRFDSELHTGYNSIHPLTPFAHRILAPVFCTFSFLRHKALQTY